MADAAQILGTDEALRLTEFARACKAAARAVVLYPAGHPAISTTLARIVQVTSPPNLTVPLRIGVVGDGLLLDGRAPSRPDTAIGELAALLHDHMIGELTVNPGGDVEAWRAFLLLVGRAPDAVRAEGGIARLWTTMASGHVEIREIDYTEVLRDRKDGLAAAWDQVIANCLQGQAMELSDEAITALLEAAGDPEQLAEFLNTLEARATEAGRGVPAKTAALMKLLQSIVEAARQREPERLEPVMRNMATAIGRLSPEMLVALITQTGASSGAGSGDGPGLVDAMVSRMTDHTIANFVAANAMSGDASLERVAEAFHVLVRNSDERERMLSMAHDEAAASPLGSTEGFEDVWENVAQKLLTSYSDKAYVSDGYARELSSARSRALEVEQINDDPPERRRQWLSTVATSELRKLDLTLVLDLLRIEEDTDRWSTLMRPVVGLLEDLMLVGDFEAAAELLAALVDQTKEHAPKDRRQQALIAVDVLVAGPMMRHIVTHLSTMDAAHFERVKAMCLSLGEVLIRPLAEALSSEERARPRERLTAILLGFGAIGRREVERLKTSPNPAVRRTAVYLLREFGGREALPELTELLGDNEQQVQREAVRAILNIGTDDAYRVLEQALAGGTPRSREAIMQSVASIRDERATPLFSYILRNVDHTGALGVIYLRAIEGLGALKDPDGVLPLKDALYRGEWWAPRRTATLRGAAAAALARIGTPQALAVLEEAARGGPRSVRAAAKAHLTAPTTSHTASRAR